MGKEGAGDSSMPSSRMIEFLLACTTGGLPVDVLRAARMRVLDSLGCGLFGATTEWGRIAAQVIAEECSQGAATVYASSGAIAPARAALVNGTATNGFELDDTAPGHVHPGAVVVPAALATAEQHGLSGSRFLLGVVAGYEAMSRTGLALGEAGWGFHITGIAGAVGAAVASGVAMGLTQQQLMRAIGIACSSAAGIKSFTQGTGGMIKRMHAGRAAESGVLACALAQRGFTAPLAALDGKFGLLETYGGKNADPHALDSALGGDYVISRSRPKVYPFCGGLHTMAQALHELQVGHAIEPGAIRRVRIGTNRRALALHAEVAPSETMAAQYSMPFTAAVSLTADPRDPRFFAGGRFDDPVLCRLAAKVELYEHPEMQAIYPRYGACVEVQLDDGRHLTAAILDRKGSPANPCSDQELKEKFACLAQTSYTKAAADEILSLVERLETMPALTPLSNALRSGMITGAGQ